MIIKTAPSWNIKSLFSLRDTGPFWFMCLSFENTCPSPRSIGPISGLGWGNNVGLVHTSELKPWQAQPKLLHAQNTHSFLGPQKSWTLREPSFFLGLDIGCNLQLAPIWVISSPIKFGFFCFFLFKTLKPLLI